MKPDINFRIKTNPNKLIKMSHCCLTIDFFDKLLTSNELNEEIINMASQKYQKALLEASSFFTREAISI